MKIERKTDFVKGYDCRRGCTDERHKKWGWKEDHGQDGDQWWYVVLFHGEDRKVETAVTLVIEANAASTIAAYPFKPPEGAALSIHVPWRLTDEEVREASRGRECEWLGRNCYGESRWTDAKDFFAKYGKPIFEPQTETFWREFEKLAAFLIDKAKTESAGLHKKCCPTCNGLGIVPKESK